MSHPQGHFSWTANKICILSHLRVVNLLAAESLHLWPHSIYRCFPQICDILPLYFWVPIMYARTQILIAATTQQDPCVQTKASPQCTLLQSTSLETIQAFWGYHRCWSLGPHQMIWETLAKYKFECKKYWLFKIQNLSCGSHGYSNYTVYLVE